MGPQERGPSFSPWQAGGTPDSPSRPAAGATSAGPSRPGPAPDPSLLFPTPSPWPTVITVLVLVVVGSIVVAGTVLGSRPIAAPPSPAPPAAAAPVPASPPPGPTTGNRLEFVSDDADGVLVIAASRWSTSGLRPPTYGTYLHVQVRLICTSGQLSYGPESFSAFDATGELFEVLERERAGDALGYGVLDAGESVTGTIVFDLPRGAVTLLLSDSASRSVTALRIPD